MKVLTESRKDELHESFLKQGLMKTFKASLDRVEYGEIEISMPFSEGVTQQHGFFHGGVVGALADSASGYAAISTIKEDEASLTAEYKINLLAPANGERLIAIGKVIKPGRTLIVCQSDVYVESSKGRVHCATMLMTMCVVKNLGHK